MAGRWVRGLCLLVRACPCGCEGRAKLECVCAACVCECARRVCEARPDSPPTPYTLILFDRPGRAGPR